MSSPLSAQVLTGRVVQEESGAPVSAALIEVFDADSIPFGAALSGADGRYTLEARASGTFTVRVRRLGFATLELGPMELSAVHPLDIVLPAAPVQLDGLVATARPVCADGPGVGPDTQRLWELVTGALDVARVAQASDLYRFDMHTYVRDRTLDGRHLLLEGAERSRESGAFVAMPLETLEDQGYVEAHRGGGLSWYMPDPPVLVSDRFLATHCFRVAEGDDPGVVGLAFDPTPDRRRERADDSGGDYRDLFGREVVEVAGVLWVDRATGALRDMEYRYVGTDTTEITRLAGGYARFEQLAGGLWIVRQWVLRIPNLVATDDGLVPESRRDVGGFVVDAFEAGVSIDLSNDAPPTSASAMTVQSSGDLTGRLVADGVPVSTGGVLVRLSGSPWGIRTDAEGRFAFRGVPPGPYLVTWWSEELKAIGIPARGIEVTVEDGVERTVRLPGPSLDFAVEHLCAGMVPDPSLGILRVLSEAVGVNVVEGQTQFTTRRVQLRSADPEVRLERSTVTRDGVATFCSVPTGVPLELGISGEADAIPLQLEASEIRSIQLRGDGGSARR